MATLRGLPQVSVPDSGPQAVVSRAQNCALVSGQLQVPLTHWLVPAQVPHVVTLRATPQLSLALSAPQLFESRVQNWVLVSEVQPHLLGWPAPAQVCGTTQLLAQVMLRARLQLSWPVSAPHDAASRVQKPAFDSGWHPHEPAVQN